MGLLDEIQEMQKKTANYNLLKEEYDRLKIGIKEARDKLNDLLGSASADIGSTTRRKVGASKVAEKLYDRMKTEDNFQVTRDMVEAEFMLADSLIDRDKLKSDSSQTMYYISIKPGVEKIKVGGVKRLIHRKKTLTAEDKLKIGKVSFMG